MSQTGNFFTVSMEIASQTCNEMFMNGKVLTSPVVISGLRFDLGEKNCYY